MSWADVFYAVTKMGATAYICGFFVCFFALVTSSVRRMPRRVTYLMLFLVIFRMVCPVSIPSPLSVLNMDFAVGFAEDFAAVDLLDAYAGDLNKDYFVAAKGSKEYREAMEAGLTPADDVVHAIFYVYDEQGNMVEPKTYLEVYGKIFVAIWLVGVALFWGYGLITYLVLKRRVSTATWVEDHVFESDRIQTPFILGFLRPKIYLPLGLSETQRRYVLCHEREHIRHGDHILKAVVYAIMSVHWYGWFLWLYFYRWFTSEIEVACDSDVLRRLGEEHKADYSEALLSLSQRTHFIGAVPCAFGESNIKERVKTALKYKTPTAFWTVLSVLLLLFAALITGTDPI